MSCFRHIFRWWHDKKTTSLAERRLVLADALVVYAAALEALCQVSSDSAIAEGPVLALLTARDSVAHALAHTGTVPPAQLQRLIALDKELRERRDQIAWADVATWRKSAQPAADRWWWWLDEVEKEKAEKSDLPWVVLASVIMTVALGLAVEIVRRLWGRGPDPLTVIAAIISLLLTGSPLTRHGRELAEWLMSKIPRLATRHRGRPMLGMAAIGLVGVAVIRFAILPPLAVYYNNRGYDHLHSGELTQARFDLQRAVSLNSEYAIAYYNLAALYEQIVEYDQAIDLYTKALEYDLNLDLLYNNLGRLYVIQGEYDRSISLLQQGLTVTQDDGVRYTLYTNLGRAYYEAKRHREAEATLMMAIRLEEHDAAAHCYLALVHEALEQSAEAIVEWENCLRTADQTTAEGSEWAAMAQAHLQVLQEEEP